MFNELTLDELIVVDGGRTRDIKNFIEDAVWGGLIFEGIKYCAEKATKAVGKVAVDLFMESIKQPVIL